ncbi:MAG: hypothetical protein NZ585_08600 [Chloracidobacterium sp.]|nr:hypothetical protein [Chloracidobacterium sp.]MDW8217363.1 hypothetical protein [Acidobacteriota bacterium]
MYRKPRFLEKLHAIRERLAEACGYDAERLAALLQSETAAAPPPAVVEESPSSPPPVWVPSQSNQ